MDAVRAHLVQRGPNVLPLLDPPFDRSAQEPGYIKAYPPGVRENGGQYTHAAVWTVMAFAALGAGDEAGEMLHMLNPVNRSRPTFRDREASGSRQSPLTAKRSISMDRTTDLYCLNRFGVPSIWRR
jgi:cellobiose phosphorylase